MTELEKSMLSFCFTTCFGLMIIAFGMMFCEFLNTVIRKCVDWVKAFKEKHRKD